MVLLGGGYSADAADRTFVWNGNENLTSFARAGNWDPVWEAGGNPVLDGDGNPTFEQNPLLDADGNPVFEPIPVTDEEGNPLFDDEGNQIYEQIPVTDEDGNPILDDDGNVVFEPGNQLFEQGAQIFELPRWVEGPPDGLDTMVVKTGSPNISSPGRSVWDLHLSGGEFVVRNSKFGISSFFVDGTLNVSGSGALDIWEDPLGQSVLTAAKVDMSGGSISGWLNPETGKLESGRLVVTGSMEQSGGSVSGVAVQTPTYALSAGTLSANVDFATLFALSGTGVVEATAKLAGAEGSTMTQSGGTMAGTVTGVDSYTHSGGNIGGSISTDTYALTDAAATSVGGVIAASESFDLALATGTAIVAAKLSGEGNLIKSGDSTVVLAHADNDFTGTVAVDAGTLEVIDDALPSYSAVTVADGATLLMNTANDTVFMGSIEGEMGELVKRGSASLTLGGDIVLGGLTIDAGKIQVGTGLSENIVSFDYAIVEQGATLYVASGATLTIRIPNNLVNNGTFINDGTVNDDLANTASFTNNGIYNAKVLSNTDSIDNNSGGVWTGDILGNADRISNNTGAEWTGDVKANAGTIYNHSDWSGDIEANGGAINNFGGTWTGDIKGNRSQITNDQGGTWNGNVLGNNNTIYNMAGSEWNGNVVGNGGGSNTFVPLVNRGLWTGNVKGNSGFIFNDGGIWDGDVIANAGGMTSTGTWTGDVKSNNSQILNEGGVWTGDILGNNNLIFNAVDSVWTGKVIANGGGSNGLAQINNYGTWKGAVLGNAAYIYNLSGSWTGDIIANTGMIRNNHNDPTTNPTGANQAVWNGDILGTNSQIINDHGGIWNGDILGNNNAIFNEIDGVWDGDVVANGGGSNIHTQIVNEGDWTGDVQTNAWAIYNEDSGTWHGDVLDNAGTIVSSGVWNGDFTSAGKVVAQGEINGAFANSGQLRVTGSLTGITTLTNTGVVSLKGGGTTQTLTVDDIDFSDGSFYDIDVDAAGASDKIVAQSAVIDGGTVRVTAANTGGTYDPHTTYTIITATDLTGEFDAVTTNLAFLAPKLAYQAASVDLTLMRNDIGFADAGVTRNQQAAAAGAESLVTGNAIYDAVLWLSPNEAARAFDHLSGEAYGSIESVSIQSAGVIADLATARVDRAFDALGDSEPMLVSAYAEGPEFAPGVDRGNAGIWAEFYGARGRTSGKGNASKADSAMAGVAGGLDGLLGDWRVGAMLHVGRTNADVDDLNTSGNSTDFGFGLYGGRQWGETRLSFGAAYTRHHWDVSRSAGFTGFSDTLSADYSTGTAQAFGKLSHAFRMGAVSLIPYASLAYVNQTAADFKETGGEAALGSQSDAIDAIFTTLGFVGNRTFVVGDTPVTAKAGLGWRHAFADTPGATRTLAGGDSFYVVGASIPKDSIMLNAGLNLDISANTMIDVTYDGQIGKDGTTSHTLKGVWARRF